MTPITLAEVKAAARRVHLEGGSEVDLQALATTSNQGWPCRYNATTDTPPHARRLVCVIGAALYYRNLDAPSTDAINDWNEDDVERLFDQHDFGALVDLQTLHDTATWRSDEDRMRLRETLGLEPI